MATTTTHPSLHFCADIPFGTDEQLPRELSASYDRRDNLEFPENREQVP